MKIKKGISILIVFFSFASCATIFNKNEQKILISSDIINAKIKYNDSIYSLPNEIKVIRKRENLNLDLVTDTLTKNFSIPYGLDTKFKSGNLLFIYFAPIGYGIDFTNNKRFSYPSKINLSFKPKELDFKNLKKLERIKKKTALRLERMERKKGDLFVNIIAPSFYSYDVLGFENRKYQKGGLVGTGLGLDYYYKDHKFLNFEFSVKTNYYDLLLSPFLLDDQLQIYNLSLTDNYRIKRFELGYGISTSYSNLRGFFYQETDEYYVGNGNQNPIQVKNKIKYDQNQINFGLTTRASYQLTGRLHVGLFFRPNFVRLNNSESKVIFESVYGMDLRFLDSTNKCNSI